MEAALHLSIVGAFYDDLGPQVFLKFKQWTLKVYHLLFRGLQLTLVNWYLKSAHTGRNQGGMRNTQKYSLRFHSIPYGPGRFRTN